LVRFQEDKSELKLLAAKNIHEVFVAFAIFHADKLELKLAASLNI